MLDKVRRDGALFEHVQFGKLIYTAQLQLSFIGGGHLDRDLILKRIAAGSVVGIAIGLAGFFFAQHGTRGMGVLLFFVVPGVGGFAAGLLSRGAKPAVFAGVIAAFIALVGCLFLLIAIGKEGFLCALMALPLIAVPIAAGAALGVAVRVLIKPGQAQDTTVGVFILVTPALLFFAKQLEKPLLDRARIETVSTSVWVPDSLDHTWSNIQSIDSIHSNKPWLMYVGLPVPQRCTLEKTALGARRTCYFNKGYIEETVTEWNPPRSMGLRIDRTHMPGRHWMGFENARYRLDQEGKGTRLTRTTVISSHLYPAWYWRPLEQWGVISEHKYILQDAANRAYSGLKTTASEEN